MSKSSPQLARPPSPPVFGVPDMSDIQRGSLNDTKPQVVYKPNNQEVVYKQNIMVRWLQPPTPPPPAPIIIRGKDFMVCWQKYVCNVSRRGSSTCSTTTTHHLSTNGSMSTNTTTDYYQVSKNFLFSSI